MVKYQLINREAKNILLDEQSDFIEKVRQLNEEFFYKTGKQRKAFTHSYGCQQNLSDTEKINGQISSMGFSFTDVREEADFIMYNTCAVRENAEDRVFGNVGALKNHKLQKPELIIGLCGCMTQQKQITDKIRKSYPFVDMILGTHAMHRLPKMLYTVLNGGKKVVDISDEDISIIEGMPIRRDTNHRAWISIMYGCNNFCTYCIVPYVRGRERSRSSKKIILEIKELISNGYREFTLLGQNVNSYGKNIDNEINFSQLLEEINSLDGDFRIRFMTSHPKDVTKKLVDTIAKCEKVERHIHLPVQSGSNKILQAMNRGYTLEKYLEILDYARNKIPDITFSTDIIVGFPGEKREDFLETMDLIKKVRYLNIYNFMYSKRTGTKAAEYKNETKESDKTIWLRELIEEQKIIGREELANQIGKTVRVLVEKEGKTGPGYMSGKNDSGVTCDFLGDRSLIGQLINLKVLEVANWAATCEYIQNK